MTISEVKIPEGTWVFGIDSTGNLSILISTITTVIIQGDRRELDVFGMASRQLLCEVGWGTSGRWPRYTMPFQ
jgi:hypothetical protein